MSVIGEDGVTKKGECSDRGRRSSCLLLVFITAFSYLFLLLLFKALILFFIFQFIFSIYD